jgi:hypothetical protein
MQAVARGAFVVVASLLVAGCGAGGQATRSAAPPKTHSRSHAIAPGGIGGVGLEMSPHRVRQILGAPTSSRVRLPHRLGFVDLVYRYGRLEIDFIHGRDSTRFVYLVSTTDPAYRTVTGLGVGSPERAVRSAATTCVSTRRETACGITDTQAGAVLSFELRRGRVFRVSVFAPPF